MDFQMKFKSIQAFFLILDKKQFHLWEMNCQVKLKSIEILFLIVAKNNKFYLREMEF